jgi:hypothetical protein
MLGKIINPNNDTWYTDSSGISNCYGAMYICIYGPKDNHRDSIPMGSLSTVFQAEVMAILKCTELLLSKDITRRIHTCLDRRGAIAALQKPPPNRPWYGSM